MDQSDAQPVRAAPDAATLEYAEPSGAQSRLKRAQPLILLGVILLVGAGLRLWGLGAVGLWLDEFLTVELSSGHGFGHLDLQSDQLVASPPDFTHLRGAHPVASIFTNSGYDVHPPLFYVLLRGWREIVPNTDAWIRGLSVLLSLVSILLLYVAVQTFAGTTPALWASLLMALAGPQIQYAQENRSYMLLIATLLGAAAALLRIERFGFNWRRGCALGFCVFAAAMTHYLAIPILAIFAFYTLLRLRGRTLWRVCGVVTVAAAVYLLIWAPFALRQQAGFGERIDFVSNAGSSLSEHLNAAAGLPLRFFTNARSQPETAFLGAALFLLPLPFLRSKPHLLLWWMWLAGGVAVVMLGDVIRERRMLTFIRYTLAASPPAYALAAMILSHLPGWGRHIVPLTLSLACIFSIESAYDRFPYQWRYLGEFINDRFRPGDMLVMDDTNPEKWKVRCVVVGMNYYGEPMPVPLVLLSKPPDEALLGQIRSSGSRIWYFSPPSGLGPELNFPACRPVESQAFPYLGALTRIELP